MPTDDPLQPLREALNVSPTNVPLRLHLADSLAAAGRGDDAEAVLKEGLTRTPSDTRLKLGLARVYLSQGKVSAGLVVCEDVVRTDESADALVLLAKLHLRAGDGERAERAYRQAVALDPEAADPELAARFGKHEEEPDDSDLEGRVPTGGFADEGESPAEVERPKVAFTDVGGMDGVKEEVRLKIIYPLAHADLYKAYGKAIGGGLLLYGPPGCGKAQPLTARVQTPSGPRPMGDIRVGDEVCVPDGGTARVAGVYPQGRKPIYRITFADGDAVEACAEHLWLADRLHGGWSGRVVTTAYLADHLRSPCGDRLMAIRTPSPLALPARPATIPPYLLGLLLGDGGFTNTNLCFSTTDAQLVESVSGVLATGYVLRRNHRPCDYRIVKERRSGLPNRYKDELRALGLWGLGSHEKFIPADFLYNSAENRWELLRGLMDTDGTAEKTGRLVYHTTSHRLAAGVKWLVESLGGIATVRVKPTTGKDCHHLGIRLNDPAAAFRLERKRARCRRRTKYFVRRVVDRVELGGEREAQCLLIDHPDHLYLTDHCVVTHNTHLARATAGEVKGSFIAVGLHDILNMWFGNTEKNLHKVFEQARRNRPCVLFFDEVDALAASRADFRQSTVRPVINQFLSELDGVEASNDGVLILAATNAPWHMDSAFRRPGRFDKIVFVPPPDAPARAAILKLHLAGKPLGEIDHAAVAKATADFSGADLKAVVDRAVEAKLAEAMRTGVPKPLVTKDLVVAAGQGKPSTREWFADARNYALYANDGGQYDDLAKYLKLR
ncbi:MAG: AAA family ATPase [Gemmataceae bacterium]|nr:AAA family ATPase [Gemmataceae bacterium]